MAGIVTRLKGLTVTDGGATVPVFDEIQDPATAPPTAGLISSDLSAARVTGRITGDQAKVERYLVPVRDAITAIESDTSGFTVHSISQTLTSQDITNLINEGLDRTFITIGLTFIILLITFGAIVASVVPLVLAVSALLAAFGILGIFSQVVTPVSPYATQLVVLIGLAVSVDYSLFMITRFRSERREGKTKLLAIETASSTAGRAVFFSGIAVMISIAGLFLIDVSIFRSMAIGTIGVIFVAVIGSLTFLPATLAILGDRINIRASPVLRSRSRRGQRDLGDGSCWRSMRHPWRYAILATAVHARPRVPVRSHLRIGLTDFTSFPDEIDGVQAVKVINEKWPQGGVTSRSRDRLRPR